MTLTCAQRAGTVLRRLWVRLPRLYLTVAVRTPGGRTWWIPVPLFLVEDLAGWLSVAGPWLLRRTGRLAGGGAGRAAAHLLAELPRLVRTFRSQPPIILAEIGDPGHQGRFGLRVLLI